MLNTIFGKRSAVVPAADPNGDDGWLGGLWNTVWPSYKTHAGVTVNQQTALTYAAVWACTRALCEPAGAMPLETYRRTSGDDREKATDYPIYELLKNSPNDDMDSQPFWEGRFQHAINWDGGGFAEIVRERDDPNSTPLALYPIHPSRVFRSPKAVEADGFYYTVRNDDGTQTPMRRWQVFHMPGALSDDGIWSKGVIPYARQSIGFGLATEEYGANFFGGGGMPRVYLKNYPSYNNPEARKTFRDEWREVHGKPAAKDIGLIPAGSELVQMSIPNEASQFLETRVHNDRVIARWYPVPLHMIQDLERGTQASIEMISIEFVIYYLWTWLRRCQGQCNLKLIPRRDRAQYYVEHNLNSLLRGDLKSRIESYQKAITTGIMTINEARRLENLPGIGPAGDVHYVPANMTTADVMLDNPPMPGTQGPGSDQSGEQGQQPPGRIAALLTHQQRDDIAIQIKELQSENGRCVDRKPDLMPAARAVVRDALGRMFVKESNAAKRAAAKGGFDEWSRDFYGKHHATMTEALQPTAVLLQAMGRSVTAEDLASQSIADSKERITAALNASPATLIAVLDSWPTERADSTADQIMRDRGTDVL